VPTGSGSDLSEEPVEGFEPAALDCRAAPWCPPGPVPISFLRRRFCDDARRRPERPPRAGGPAGAASGPRLCVGDGGWDGEERWNPDPSVELFR
jgi:hypothetical protein